MSLSVTVSGSVSLSLRFKLHKAEDSLAVKSPKASTASASEKTCVGLVGNRFDSQSEKALALGPGR